ncbi:MAG TPA: AAA family ATPase [Methylomirabilota bacterium]|nr:AAA family ATPase [Methylomirabilota bacterium]
MSHAHARLLADLLRPGAYPPPAPSQVELVTTHISWVFLTDREAWKLKRPVRLAFLDYTTPERRRHFCEEEVRLNRRLAPDVYRGVAPVRLGPSGHTFRDEGQVVDHAVRMRRLAPETSAEARLAAGTLGHDDLGAVATRLAGLYATAVAAPAYGALEVVRRNAAENFEETRPARGHLVPAATFDAVEAWQLGFLAAHPARFTARVAQGRIREGHGDLRLEHVHFEGGPPSIIDCIEFSERFRMGDAAADAGFLAMELDARERPDLAASFLARFARESNDYDLYGVIDFYLSYRAWVRAKVAALLAGDPSTPPDKAARKVAEARRLFALAERYGRPPPGPTARLLLAVGGLIGTGKTALAEGLGQALGLPVVEADRTRKWLAGVAPTDRAPARAYEPAFSARTFEELFRRAAVVLESGRGVILDATFRGRDLRRRARDLAHRHGCRFLFIETTLDEARLRERLRRRALAPAVSDATEALLPRMRAEFEPVLELSPAEHLVVRTSEPVADLVAAVRRVLGV